MNRTISDLGKKTEAARAELKELGSATQEGYDAVKTRLTASLAELKDAFDKASTVDLKPHRLTRLKLHFAKRVKIQCVWA